MSTARSHLIDMLQHRPYFLMVLIVVVGAVMSFLSPFFLRINTLLGMTRFGAMLALVAFGQTLIIIAGGGGIDLAVGSMISLAAVVFGVTVDTTGSVTIGVVAAVTAGATMGAFNGCNIVLLRMPPLIATLGSMYAFGAIALVATGGTPISGFPEWFGSLGYRTVLGVPVQILLVVAPAFGILWFVLNRTTFGRNIYLVGVNETAARFAGIGVGSIRFTLYVVSGVLSALAGLVASAWLMTARPDIGRDIELQAITVTVLGGANIFGGEGSLTGTLLAVLIVTMVATGLQLANINTVWQLGAIGVILLASVALNQWLARTHTHRKHKR